MQFAWACLRPASASVVDIDKELGHSTRGSDVAKSIEAVKRRWEETLSRGRRLNG